MYEMKLEEIISNLYEGVYVVDRSRKIVFWNKGAEEITGYKSEDVVNSMCYNNILRHIDHAGKSLCHDGCPLLDTILTGKQNQADVFLHHKDGYRVPVSVKSLPLYDGKGEIVAAIEVFTDTRYKQDTIIENRRLKEMLVIDPLTLLHNRRYLDFHLGNLVNEHKQFNTSFGILFFDIDHFKHINDTYGHNTGDEVLKIIAQTLKSNIRSEDVVGRWGGEEFIAVIKGVNDIELKSIAEKLRRLCELSTYKRSDDLIIKVTVSIGGTLYTSGEKIEECIERADSYMYESKINGRNQSTIK